jgi:hypothetical protein
MTLKANLGDPVTIEPQLKHKIRAAPRNARQPDKIRRCQFPLVARRREVVHHDLGKPLRHSSVSLT